jgi:Tfp pilus assembly protein PilO
MDEALLRQLTRQLKIMNFWITSVGVVLLAAVIICIILLIKVVGFVHHIQDQISSLEQKTTQSLDVKQKLCDKASIANYLQSKSDVCR